LGGIVVLIATIAAIASIATIAEITIIPIGGRFCSHSREPAVGSSSVPVFPQPTQFKEEPAKGMFLIAAPQLQDPNFAKSVVLLIDYGETGAMGLVVNRPTDMALSKVFPDIQRFEDRTETLFFGGPVQLDSVFILVRSESQASNFVPLIKNLYLTGDPSALVQSFDDQYREARAYAGYAGWAPRQLDAEIARGDWGIVPADAQTVFDAVPEEMWQKLMNRGKIRSVEWRGGWEGEAAAQKCFIMRSTRAL
jgi:putative transcriptional regulator